MDRERARTLLGHAITASSFGVLFVAWLMFAEIVNLRDTASLFASTPLEDSNPLVVAALVLLWACWMSAGLHLVRGAGSGSGSEGRE